MIRILGLAMLAACLMSRNVAEADPAANLLVNGSFEVQGGGKPVGWESRQWGGKTTWVLSDESHTGKCGLMLQSDQGANFSVVTKVPVEPFAVYRLSGWIKTQNVQPKNGLGAMINIHDLDSAISQFLTGTNDWTEVEVVFRTCGQEYIWVNCCLGGWGDVSGEAWYDDLALQQIGSYDLDYSYLFQKDVSTAPHVEFYGGKTAIADHAFVAPPPQLSRGKGSVRWRLIAGPLGMTVNPKNGETSWQKPTWGHHLVVIEAKNPMGRDILDYSLIVVKNQLPQGAVVETDHMDFVLPPEGVQWFEKWKPHALLNAQYAYLRKLIGHEPAWDGKQIVQYRPDMGGGAHSGNPAMVGPGFWRNRDDVGGWSLGIWFHEVGHNFNAQAPVTFYSNIEGFDYHHHCAFLAAPLFWRTVANPAEFGLEGVAAANYRRWVENESQQLTKECQGYADWLKNGGTARTYRGNGFHLWGVVCDQLVARYGIELIEKTLRGMRTDGIPASLRETARKPLERNALLYCMMSHAANTDLRSFFMRMGYEFDEDFYTAVDEQVGEIMKNLPDEDDLAGWKKCPHNGHYYRRTAYDKNWHAAEVEARQFGGHLATIRNTEELEWLQSRFGIYPRLWIGLHCAGARQEWDWISNDFSDFVRWDNHQPVQEDNRFFTLLATDSGRWQTGRSPVEVHPGIIEAEAKAVEKDRKRPVGRKTKTTSQNMREATRPAKND